MDEILFHQLFERESSTYTYIVADPVSREAVLIDPVMETVERDQQVLAENNLRLQWILETHVHADHITGAARLRAATGARIAMGRAGHVAGADRLLDDGDRIEFGCLALTVLTTPGHTGSCVSYKMVDRVFTGDALLIGGCGRTDFQEGSAERLYDSIHQKIFSLPETTLIYPSHDYEGRTHSTVGDEKRGNPRLGGGKSKAEFVEIMANLQLAPPKKIAVALPANLRCGQV